MPHVHAFPMHTYFLFNILDIFDIAWDFFDCLFFLSLSFCLRWLCLWHLSVNPLRPGTLFIPVPFRLLIPPLSLRFCDDDAHKAFLENFSRRGVHSERQVILANFADTNLPTVIHSREWESLCDVPVTCPLMLI